MKVVLLVSGNLGLHCLNNFPRENDIQMIFTDKGSEGIIEFAKVNDIPVFIGNPRNGKASGYINTIRPDVLFSINYLFLVERDMIGWPSLYCFNIHGSLLPKYRGRTPHVWSIINGEKETGATVHLVDDGCDTGPVVLQEKFEIGMDDTGAIILQRFTDIYPQMISKVLEMVEENDIHPQIQEHSSATRFGARNEESGLINWQWQKERIRNWVRAQAKPYPMAFSFLGGEKIKINKISFSDLGFDGDDPDGLVLSLQNGVPIVKTPNGAVALVEFDGPLPEPGIILK